MRAHSHLPVRLDGETCYTLKPLVVGWKVFHLLLHDGRRTWCSMHDQDQYGVTEKTNGRDHKASDSDERRRRDDTIKGVVWGKRCPGESKERQLYCPAT